MMNAAKPHPGMNDDGDGKTLRGSGLSFLERSFLKQRRLIRYVR
jgi:hypothetical protein